MSFTPEKCRQIVEYRNNNHTVRQTADHFKINTREVLEIAYSIALRPRVANDRRGRPKKITGENLTKLDNIIMTYQFMGLHRLIRIVKEQMGIDVSYPTLCHYARLLRANWMKPKRQKILQPNHTFSREKFAKENRNTDFKCVLFADEFNLTLNDTTMFRQKIGQRVVINKDLHPEQVRVWWVIGFDMLFEPIFYQGNLSADEYISQILEVFFTDDMVARMNKSGCELMYLHDNAPAHRARKTHSFFEKKGIKVVPNWPPYSPDINCIENAWSVIKAKVAQKFCQTLIELEEETKKAIGEWTIEENNNLILSMPKRMNELILNKGQKLKY